MRYELLLTHLEKWLEDPDYIKDDKVANQLSILIPYDLANLFHGIRQDIVYFGVYDDYHSHINYLYSYVKTHHIPN